MGFFFGRKEKGGSGAIPRNATFRLTPGGRGEVHRHWFWVVLASAILLPLGLLSGCSPADAWTDDTYIQDLFVWNGVSWDQITTNGGIDTLQTVTANGATTNVASSFH